MTKPLLTSNWKRATIFIHDRPDEYDAALHPTLYGMAVNRKLYDGCRFFYTTLSMTGCCNRAGKASFNLVQMGDADPTTEIPLVQANKYVEIVAGTDLLWSGKILRATNSTQGNFLSGTKFPQEWKVECESDVSKMKLQSGGTLAPTNSITSMTVGETVSGVVTDHVSGDLDWNGSIEMGLRSYEGSVILNRRLDSDMYSQFITLMNTSGFEWRTRFINIMTTGTWDGTDKFTISSGTFDPYSDDEFIGKWVLLFHDTLADSSDNTKGVIAFGYCSDNTTTTITLTNIKNGSLIPTGAGAVKAMVLYDPVVDVLWDLMPATPQQTFYCNKTRNMSDHFCYNYEDKTDMKTLATKVTVKAKDTSTRGTVSGASNTISTTIYGINKWRPEYAMFDNSSICTYQTDAYIYSYTSGATKLYLIGGRIFFYSGETFQVCGITASGNREISSVATVVSQVVVQQPDGATTTEVTLASSLKNITDGITPLSTILKYSVFATLRTYVDYNLAETTTPYTLTVGGTNNTRTSNSASSYDDYLGRYYDWSSIDFGDEFEDAVPILPGCLLVNADYSVAAPGPESPLKHHGLIVSTDTVDLSLTKGELEAYATQALINHSFYLRKGSFSCLLTDFLKPGERIGSQLYDWQLIKEGDRVATLVNNSTDPYNLAIQKHPDGQYMYQWQIMSWTLDMNTMRVSVELGDFEQNVFSLISSKTSAFDSLT